MKTRRRVNQPGLGRLVGVCAVAALALIAGGVRPALAATPTQFIYDDELQNMWKNGSWKSEIDFEHTDHVYSGAYSIEAKLEGKGALCFAFKEGKNLRRQYALVGWINGGDKGGQDVRIAMTDLDGNILPNNHGVRLADKAFIQGGAIAGDTWQPFIVPISVFNVGFKGVTRIIFFNPTDEPMPAFCLDEVGLTDQRVGLGAEGAAGEVAVVPVVRDRRTAHIIYADRLQNRWENWSWPKDLKNPKMDSADRPFQGRHDIFVTQNGGDGLAFGRGKVMSTKGYKALEFYVRGARNGGQRLDVGIYGGDNQEIGSVRATSDKYMDGAVSATTWKRIYIPLRDLKGDDVEINKIAIMNRGNQTSYYVDNVCLVK